MKLLLRTLALTRGMALRRQFKQVSAAIDGLVLAQRKELLQLTQREFSAAASSPLPHLYASKPTSPYAPFGTGVDLAMERLNSENPPLRLRGLALWLAVAYHETRESQQYSEFVELHKGIQRCVRMLKESVAGKQNQLPSEFAIVA